jgi:hypothetical protein
MLIIEHLKIAELIPINLRSKVHALISIVQRCNETETLVQNIDHLKSLEIKEVIDE